MKRATAIVLALVLAVSLFTACSSGSSSASSGARYKAGTYTVTVDGRNGPLTMEGVFTEDAIESLTVTSHSETEGISDGAIQDLPQQIVDAQSLQVDAVAGATITSEAVITAVKDLVEQYAPAYSGEYNTTMISDTGDAITMGLEVGADVYTSGFMMGGTGHTYMTEADLEATYADHTTPKTSVYLNPLGLRVNSEDPIAYTASACYVNPDGPDYYWAILNEEQAQSTGYIQYIDEIMANGGDAYKADSLDELANLRYSMNRYNQFCENGVDEDYGKSADYLVKMEEGPWYAVKATMTYFGTVGGLVTNENAEVLAPEGTAIPGLYAAGEASNGGFFNMSYSGGFALSIDATMGRIAGTNAAKLAV